MSKIAVIIPYFGQFPNYFDLWMRSATENDDVTFLIFTDIVWNKEVPKNIKFIQISFDEIKRKVNEILDFDFRLENPYKLCDYRPIFGLIFEDYLTDYDFWGYCDVDLIFGIISNYVNDEILNHYDRVYKHGHFCLYRNDDRVNKFSLMDSTKYNMSAKDFLSLDYSSHFDEGFLIRRLCEEQNILNYYSLDFADIDYSCLEFKNAQPERAYFDSPQIYEWNKGKVTKHYISEGSVRQEEVEYLHLQKRKMLVSGITYNTDRYLIVPNEFIPYEEVTYDLITKYSKPDHQYEKNQKKMKIRRQIENIQKGALLIRWKKIWK